jgi:hypothetical protein
MKKLNLQLSKFDIVMIAVFVVIGLIGAGAWFYLSGMLQAAQAADAQVKSDYDASVTTAKGINLTADNVKKLNDNNTLLKDQIDPVISAYLLAKDNDLGNVRGEDPVAWKHDLDEDIKSLTTDAKSEGVKLADHFYFGFSRYQTESPSDAATAVLTKQRKGIKAISEILIKSPVKAITNVQRSYEEDPHSNVVPVAGNAGGSGDELSGYAVVVPDTYTAYPFEVDFDASPEALRPILNGLIKSPYLFLVRRIEVHNEKTDSPRLDDLPKMAGGSGAAPSVVGSSPGDVAANTPTVGPQDLFGYGMLHVKMRIDMIEWNSSLKGVEDLPTPGKKTP